jgi:hypothetical protein
MSANKKPAEKIVVVSLLTSDEEESSDDNTLAAARSTDNYLVAAARLIANRIMRGRRRRMPRTAVGFTALINDVVLEALNVPVLEGKPEGSKRFCVYMAVCFCIGRKSTKMLPSRTILQVKEDVRACSYYDELMDL